MSQRQWAVALPCDKLNSPISQQISESALTRFGNYSDSMLTTYLNKLQSIMIYTFKTLIMPS